MTNLPDRFWQKVDKHGPNGCWQWLAGTNPAGYGRFFLDGGQMAHRLSYIDVRGVIPKPLVIDHLCRNRRCVNPWHMDVVTLAVNNMRGEGACAQHARKSDCVHGHPFTEANTYIATTGARVCRECGRQSQRRYNARKKAINAINSR